MAVYPCSPPMYTKITQLCDDCLLMIFSYLPLSEVFRLQLVCHRFKTIVRLRCSAMTRSLKMFSSKEFNTNYHSLMKRLNCDSTKEAASTDNVLQLLKESYLPSTLARLPNLFPRVTSLVLDCCVGDFNAYALKFWHQNLTTLSIGCFNGIRKKVRDELLWKNLAPMTALTSLTCMGDNEPKVSDDMVTVLKRLKIFVVDQCPIQWLYHLGPNLVRLHIYNGNHESLTGWEALLDDKDSLPNRRQMTHLQVAGDQSHHSTEHVPTLCHYIVDNFPALTHLDISLFIYKSYLLPWKELVVTLGQLPQLTHFTLNKRALVDMCQVKPLKTIKAISQVTTLRLIDIDWEQLQALGFKEVFETLALFFVNLKHLKVLSVEKSIAHEDTFVNLVRTLTKWSVDVEYLSNLVLIEPDY